MTPDELVRVLGFVPTEEQLEAVTAPLGPGLIVAGAGSGKTTVMAARVVWLVGTGQVAPERVLGLTFTNKAAAELAARVSLLLKRSGLAVEDEPRVSTYHAFAGRLVAEHGLRLGLEPRSRLLADATRFQLAARVLRRRRAPLHHLTGQLTDLVGKLVSLDGELSEHLVSPEALRAWDAEWVEEVEGELSSYDGVKGVKGHTDALAAMVLAARRRQELAELVDDYRAARRDLDAVDFGDQVALAARLAEEVAEVGALEREATGVVLLDEYQDTSVAQRRMLAGIFGGGHPVTAVGDPCQAIYGWRGAAVSNLDDFPEHFPCATGDPAPRYTLSVNQRSGGRLLRLANAVSAALRGRHDVVELKPPLTRADLGHVRVGLHTSWPEETAWVAEEVDRARAAGTPPSEIAVLVRGRKDFAPLHAALVERGVPVEVVGLGGLLALPEVADVVAVLEVLEEPTANAALVRILTGPRWRLGPRDLAQLGRRGRALLHTGVEATDAEVEALEKAVERVDPCDVVSLSDALERPGEHGWSPEGLTRVRALAAELRQLRAHRAEPLLDLVHRVVEVTGLDVELSASPEAVAARRRENLGAFLDVVAGFNDLDGETSLTSFLSFLRAADEHERGLDTSAPVGGGAVQLLTAHKAKGLEWDVVVVPDLTRGVFPSAKGRDSWTTHADVLPGPLRGDADDQPALTGLGKDGLAAFREEQREDCEREERRLAYVAFTRARGLLVASGHWWGPSQVKPRGPSPFLDELRAHALDGHGEVVSWAEPPPEERNPALAEKPTFTWPAPYAPEPFARRTAAAARVRALRDVLADGGGLPEDGPLTPREREDLARLDREAALLLEEERTARRAQREVALPLSLSASQVVRLREDEDAFARELARPMPRPPAPAARRGTRFHAWVESLFDERPLLDPSELPGAEDEELGTDGDLAALQQAFLASPWSERRPHAVEAPFALPLGGRVVRGRIDAVYDLGGGRWKVVDWKTGREASDPLQLAVYRLAWAQLRGVPVDQVDASFLYVRSGKEVAHDDLPGEAELTALLTGTAPPPEVLTLL
ncbi:MAG TPA: ATP-dependent DNA helicase [Mycobacteriales bacterium]|nr:ATP-dependent DNA helicase [Mycobacteriales bacterium]